MKLQVIKERRRGAVAVEAALVYPVLIALLLGMIIGGVGVFRHQQVACHAREAARWAAVRGGDYQRNLDMPSPTKNQIFQHAVEPAAAGMAADLMTFQVEWIDQATGTAYDWDSAPLDVLSINATGEYVTNTVRVTVTYRWTPNFLGVGPLYLRSTCERPMAH